MTKKLLFIDTETTGLVPGRHGVIQIAAVVDVWSGGKLIKTTEGSWLVRPYQGDFISDKSLEINRRTNAELWLDPFVQPEVVVKEFVEFLDGVVDKFDKNDKLHPCGYNVSFDIDMLSAWFKKAQFEYFWSYINNQRLDPMMYAYLLTASGHLKTENHKLETIAAALGVEFSGEGAHDAMSDVLATRELFYKMQHALTWDGQSLHLGREAQERIIDDEKTIKA